MERSFFLNIELYCRDESMRLMEILKSRLVDDSNAEGEGKAASVISQGQGKGNLLDNKIPSTSNVRTQYDLETPMPRLQSNVSTIVTYLFLLYLFCIFS